MSKGCMNKKLCFSEKWKFTIFGKRVNSRLQKTLKTRFVRVFWQSLFMQPLLTRWFWIFNKNRNMTLGVYGVLKNRKIHNFDFVIFVEIVQFLSISWSG